MVHTGTGCVLLHFWQHELKKEVVQARQHVLPQNGINFYPLDVKAVDCVDHKVAPLSLGESQLALHLEVVVMRLFQTNFAIANNEKSTLLSGCYVGNCAVPLGPRALDFQKSISWLCGRVNGKSIWRCPKPTAAVVDNKTTQLHHQTCLLEHRSRASGSLS